MKRAPFAIKAYTRYGPTGEAWLFTADIMSNSHVRGRAIKDPFEELI